MKNFIIEESLGTNLYLFAFNGMPHEYAGDVLEEFCPVGGVVIHLAVLCQAAIHFRMTTEVIF